MKNKLDSDKEVKWHIPVDRGIISQNEDICMFDLKYNGSVPVLIMLQLSE